MCIKTASLDTRIGTYTRGYGVLTATVQPDSVDPEYFRRVAVRFSGDSEGFPGFVKRGAATLEETRDYTVKILSNSTGPRSARPENRRNVDL